MGKILAVIASGFGLGYVPFAPGTAGSLLAIPIWLLCVNYAVSWPIYLLITVILIGIGLLACAEGERRWGHDPGRVVIDEVAGQWLTLLIAGQSGIGWLIAAFVLFRLFDIWKPGPVDKLQNLPGAWGVMCDDLLAGVFGGIILLIASMLI
jgi:phosphatidylglycerophosphatase A